MSTDPGLDAAKAALSGSGEEPARSPEWEKVKNAHLQVEPRCVCCGSAWQPGTPVQVHHIFPFHYCIALGRPDLELDPRNLVTLCETEGGDPGQNHHLVVGHLGDFEAANPSSRTDAAGRYLAMAAAQIKASTAWIAEVQARLPLLTQMTPADQASFLAMMNARMPQPS